MFDNMGADFESESSFETLFDDLKLYLKEEYEIEFECNDSLRFSEILKDKTLKKLQNRLNRTSFSVTVKEIIHMKPL